MVNKRNAKIIIVLFCIFLVLGIFLIAQEVFRVRIPEEYTIKQAVYFKDSASSHTSYFGHTNYNVEVKGAEYRELSDFEDETLRDAINVLSLRGFDFTAYIDVKNGDFYQVFIETPKRDYRFDFHENADCVGLYVPILNIKLVFGNANQFIDFIQKL